MDDALGHGTQQHVAHSSHSTGTHCDLVNLSLDGYAHNFVGDDSICACWLAEFEPEPRGVFNCPLQDSVLLLLLILFNLPNGRSRIVAIEDGFRADTQQNRG